MATDRCYATRVTRGIYALAACSAAFVPAALVLTAGGAAQTETTAPPEVITVKITMTDAAFLVSPKSAPRGDIGRFILVNRGKRAHTFALGHTQHGTGSQTGFTRKLGPGQQAVLILFLDYRGLLPYRGTLPADRDRAAMQGTFRIT
jgi:hypothetical protein